MDSHQYSEGAKNNSVQLDSLLWLTIAPTSISGVSHRHRGKMACIDVVFIKNDTLRRFQHPLFFTPHPTPTPPANSKLRTLASRGNASMLRLPYGGGRIISWGRECGRTALTISIQRGSPVKRHPSERCATENAWSCARLQLKQLSSMPELGDSCETR